MQQLANWYESLLYNVNPEPGHAGSPFRASFAEVTLFMAAIMWVHNAQKHLLVFYSQSFKEKFCRGIKKSLTTVCG